jgi:hypothetical protein
MSLAADANLAEGLELNNLKFLIYPAGTRRITIKIMIIIIINGLF